MSEQAGTTDPKNLREVLENFWLLAKAICGQVEAFRPELVIALLHSGEGPLRAALALWEEARDAPFPPVVRTNLGREKVSLYNELRWHLGKDRFRKWVDGVDEEAHLLAWAAEQHAWQAELADQVGEVLGEDVAPNRVLVVDDFVVQGTTWLLALGLLKTIFPQAEARHIASSLSDWGGDLVRFWLQEHYPDVYAAMEADTPVHHRLSGKLTCFDHLRRIAPGTEDVDAASLTWRLLTADSKPIQELTRFMPAETWLAMPALIYAAVDTYVRHRAREISSGFSRGGSPYPASASADSQASATIQWLTPTHLILRQAWLTSHVTRHDVAAICRVSLSQAKRMLRNLAREGHLIRRGRRPSIWYDLPLKTGILVYYGSPLTDPESAIASIFIRRIEEVETPFEVEYACSSRERAGAPVLVPVPDGIGICIPAQLTLMQPYCRNWSVYRDLKNWRESRTGNQAITSEHSAAPDELDPVWIEYRRSSTDPSGFLDRDSKQLLTARSREFFTKTGVTHVLYARLTPDLDFVLEDDLSARAKAARLAELAVNSVIPETFGENCDGIRYLADAIRHGIHTPLTDLYRQAILRLAGDAPNLESARRRIARQKGILAEQKP